MRMIVDLLYILLFCSVSLSFGFQFPAPFVKMISSLCVEAERGMNNRIATYPDEQLTYTCLDVPNGTIQVNFQYDALYLPNVLSQAIEYLFPPVIFWSPIEQFAGVICNKCPKCRMNGDISPLVPVAWTSGESADHRPRLLQGVESNVILVSRIYSCSSHHTVYGHHPGLIDAFTHKNLKSLVPLLLWHITGFTSMLVEHIDHMIHSGTTMLELESCLVDKRARLFYIIQARFKDNNGNSDGFPDFDDDSMQFWRLSPSQHTIESLFLQRFWEREKVYHNCMSQLSISSHQPWLSCDHTFKSVKNVGTFREADRHWIKQYSGLFCVLNGEGEVLSWKLTKTLTFDEMESMHSLCLRLQKKGQALQQITGDTERFGLFSANITTTETEFHANTPKNKVQMEQLEYETVRDDLQFLSNLCDDDESAVEGGDTLNMTGEEAMQILEEAISAFYVS